MGDLEERLARRKAELEARQAPPEQPQFDEDLVPQVEESTYQRTEADEEVDRVVDGFDILDAYRKWCGKMTPVPGNKREGIKISCPRPEHRDADPSAWVNLDNQTWFCGGCQEGGDKYDIAAWHFGYPVPGYKSGQAFPDLKRLMAQDLGVSTVKGVSGKVLLATSEPEQEVSQAAEANTPAQASQDLPDSSQDSTAVLIQFPQPGDFDDAVIEYPSIDWTGLVQPDTFMATWMDVTKHDDLPEEFYFWLGLLGLGFAIGRDAYLQDNPIVRGNLYVCLYGHTGQGKSRSIGALNQLLAKALPYDNSDPRSTGAYMVPSPGSAEALVDAFSRPIEDPTDPKAPPTEFGHVRGLVRFDELSTLIGRASRMGNPMKPMLMEFFDGYAPVEHKTRGMGHVRAEGYFCSTVTTTQPKAIRDLLIQTDVDSGFVNRWVFACGQDKTRVSIGRASLDIDAAVGPLQRVRTWASSGREILLDEYALKVWDAFFHDELQRVQRADETGLYARADLTLKKVMLLLSCDRRKTVLGAEEVYDTITLWQYLQQAYKLLSGQIGMGPYEDMRVALEKAMIGHFTRHGKHPTMREVQRLVAHRKFPGDQIVKVIKAMITLGEVEELAGASGPGTRMSTVRYRYVE